MRIHADQRSIEAHREPASEQAITAGLSALRDLQIHLAKAFARIDASAHFLFSGCACVVEYAVKQGYSPFEARTLVGLGQTITAAPDAEHRVRRGELTVEAASAIGRILARPELVAGPAGSSQAGWNVGQWLDAAGNESFTKLKRRIKEHVETLAQQEVGIEEIVVHVPARTKDAFARAREVASQKAGKFLSEGQVFQRIVDFYLDKNDPLRAKEGTRRLGPTSERPGDAGDPSSRYVPAAVRRAVWRRARGTCEVPGCNRRHGLELAHRVPHAAGSAREVDDLGLLCHVHHLLYDAGRLAWPVGEAERSKAAGARGAPPQGASADGGCRGAGAHGIAPSNKAPPGARAARREDPTGPPDHDEHGASRVCEPSLRWRASRVPVRAAV